MKLNTGKFKVIHELEAHLPFNCFEKEWEGLTKGDETKRYFQLTRVKSYIPMILGVPFIVLLIYVMVQVVS